MTVVIAAGTRKGLWLATSGPDGGWSVTGPALAMREVPSLAFLRAAGGAPPELLAGVRSEHWGPTVARSADLGASWSETEEAAVRFPADTAAALERIWQLHPDPVRPEVVWAGCEPISLWRSTDGGHRFELVRALWDHPHRRRRRLGAAQPRHRGRLPARPRARVRAVRAQGGGGRGRPGPALRAEPRRRLPLRRRRRPVDVDRGRAAGRLRLSGAGPPRAVRDGCLYASTDSGETFTEVAAHLPDVLCVRAAAYS